MLAWSACGEPSNATVARCEAQCDAASDCELGSSSCLDKCEAEYDTARHIDCVLEYEAILECVDTLADLCAVENCSNEVAAYSVCLGAFCGTEPSDPLCGAAPAGGSSAEEG